MKAFQNLTGRKFGRLTVLMDERGQGNNPRLLCVCECGKKTRPFKFVVLNGHTKSCGCLAAEVAGQRFERLVEIDGESKNLTAWGKVIGVTRERARQIHGAGKLVDRVRKSRSET